MAVSFLLSFCVVSVQYFFEKDTAAAQQGGQVGVVVGQQIVAKDEVKGNSVPNGFLGGVSGSYFVNEEVQKSFGNIQEQIRTIRETADLLAVDVMKNLNASSRRADELDLYVNALQEQGEKITAERAKNKELIAGYKGAAQAAKNEANRLKKLVNQGITDQNPDLAQQAYDAQPKYDALYAEYIEAARVRSVFDGKYAKALSIISQRIKFFTANRVAVIQGTYVVNVKDTQVKLIFSESEWRKIIQ